MSISDPKNIRRILIVKLCCIGDIVQMTPALRALKMRFPQAQMDFLCASWVQNIAQRVPGINEVILWDEPYKTISWAEGLFSFLRLARELSRRRYDLAFIGHRSPVFGALAFFSRIPLRAGFKSGINLFLNHPVLFNPQIHETQRYLAIAQALNIPSTGQEYSLDLKGDEQASAQKIAEQAGLDLSLRPIAIFPGGGQNPGTSMKIKRWEKEKYAELIKQLPPQILLLGNQSDHELCSWLKNATDPTGNSVFNLAGQTTITELLGLLKNCRLVIGGDSGPLYLAAALGTPTLMLFGPSSPNLVAPPGPNHRQLWKQVSCSPCYTPDTVYDRSRFKSNEFICWTQTHDCLKTLSVNEVSQAVREILSARDPISTQR
ncbi:MAG: lipopolysaccharide heptosyltransferase II [Elusimicrobia bacterium]|nr:lipopolysaccharide heptosyltransferase II [Elusimicrobiota bacterium]